MLITCAPSLTASNGEKGDIKVGEGQSKALPEEALKLIPNANLIHSATVVGSFNPPRPFVRSFVRSFGL
ncbi:hypothetical protein BX600DRAFT_476457, partial [Xylariales sp. PMI_506]